MRMRSSSNIRMRIALLLELRMRITWLRMCIINLDEIFDNLRKIGQKTEFIPARPHHQNVKENFCVFLNISNLEFKRWWYSEFVS